MGVIGDTLSEARTRRAVGLEQIEAATGIRARYLRAIEQEDWDALPEDFYARSFIRKYAGFVGVAPEPLVEEFRRQRGGASQGGAPTSPFARTSSRRAEALRRRRRRQAVYAWGGAAVLVAAIVAAIVLLASGGGGGGPQGGKNAAGRGPGVGGAAGAGKGTAPKGGAAAKAPPTVKLAIEPTAEVWACVLGGNGKPLVAGATLLAGEMVGPFRSRSYTAAFGNGSVHVRVNGALAHTPAASGPIGLTIDAHGKVRELPKGERPTCE